MDTMDSLLCTAISQAARNGKLETVKLLLEDKRLNPAASNNSGNGCGRIFILHYAAIIEAVSNDQVEVVKCLMQDKGVDPSADNNKGNSDEPIDPLNFDSNNRGCIKWILRDSQMSSGR